MKRLLFFIAFMSLATVGLIQLLVTEAPETGAPVTPRRQVSNVLDMDGVNVKQIEGKHLRWELRAEQAVYNENTNTGWLQRVSFRIHGPETAGAPGAAETVYVGHSREAFLQSRPDKLVLRGQVVITGAPEMEIRSEQIEYDQATQLVISPGPVTVRTPQGVQEGASLRYDIVGQRLDFANPVFYR